MTFREAYKQFIEGQVTEGLYDYNNIGTRMQLKNGYSIAWEGGSASSRDITTTYILDKEGNIIASETNDW